MDCYPTVLETVLTWQSKPLLMNKTTAGLLKSLPFSCALSDIRYSIIKKNVPAHNIKMTEMPIRKYFTYANSVFVYTQ